MNGSYDLRFPTSPQDCAVLVALPLTYADFETDLLAFSSLDVRSTRGDYSARMAGENATLGWERHGSKISDLCNALFEIAALVGVDAYPQATLADISEAATRKSVLVILAHWRGVEVMSADLKCGAYDELERHCSAFTSRVSVAVRLAVHRTKSASEGRFEPYRLADCLNEEVVLNSEFGSGSSDDVGIGAHDRIPWWQIRNRDALDDFLSPFLVPGNCLELRDGYHKAGKIAQALPQDWCGLIELSACHSSYLGSTIQRGYHNTRRMITNERSKHPQICIPELCETFARLPGSKKNYAAIRAVVFNSYIPSVLAKRE